MPVSKLKVDWHFKLSLPLSCLVFALCAAPLSLRFSRVGSYSGILLGIVIMFLVLEQHPAGEGARHRRSDSSGPRGLVAEYHLRPGGSLSALARRMKHFHFDKRSAGIQEGRAFPSHAFLVSL